MKTIMNFLRDLHRLFTKPAAQIGLGVLASVGFVAGIVFWQAFNTGMETTNQEEFCVSCHTMRDNLLPELQKTVHWNNRSGVRARCPDCHVPHNFTDKVARKMQASREVFAHVSGEIGSREKFKERRVVLAQREWARFRANSSKECRNCHDYKDMNFDKMRVTSQTMMRSAAERNASCVDCHKGIAHQLPSLKGARNPAFDTLVSEAQGQGVSAGQTYYSVLPQDIYADEGLSQKIGTVEVATPLKVLEKKDRAVKLELSLWRKNKGYGRVWFGYFGLNITNAVLNKEVAQDAQKIQVAESKEDALTGLSWQKVSTQVWIKSGGLLGSPEPIWEVARNSYETSCSVCHRQPVASGHDANQWPGLFSGMVGFTNLDDDTAKLVLKYLQTHSSDFAAGKQTSSATLENTLQTAKP